MGSFTWSPLLGDTLLAGFYLNKYGENMERFWVNFLSRVWPLRTQLSIQGVGKKRAKEGGHITGAILYNL